MKKFYVFIGALLSGISAIAQITVSGSSVAATNATYTSLTKSGGAFAALNAAGAYSSGDNISISVTADVTTEDASTSLSSGTWNSITITPSGVRTISGGSTGALLNLNGADNVTVNGLNSSGNSLTIFNTSTSSTASTILFIGDASNNTITNCTIKGSAANASGGVIVFGAGSSTGNDNNTISNNIIAAGSSIPCNVIYSVGTSSAIDNSGNTISGNSLSDYFNSGAASYGIIVSTGNSGWTISGNSIFQTGTRTAITASTMCGISIGAGSGYTVTGNYIGGGAVSCGGSAWTLAGNLNNRFLGIDLAAVSGTTNNVQGNTITNIFLNTSFTLSTGAFIGINIGATTAAYNIGTSSGNTIGIASNNGSANGGITMQQVTSSGGVFYGINSAGTGSGHIPYKNIDGVVWQNTVSTKASLMQGAYHLTLAEALITAPGGPFALPCYSFPSTGW